MPKTAATQLETKTDMQQHQEVFATNFSSVNHMDLVAHVGTFTRGEHPPTGGYRVTQHTGRDYCCLVTISHISHRTEVSLCSTARISPMRHC